MTFQFISDTVIVLLTYVKYLIIINYQSLSYDWMTEYFSHTLYDWTKAVFWLEVFIYKRLQILRHNYVISRNEYLISTVLESIAP